MVFIKSWTFWGLFLFARARFIVFPGLPLEFHLMRGQSFVELTEHDNSTADIIVHSMYIYVLLLHS